MTAENDYLNWRCAELEKEVALLKQSISEEKRKVWIEAGDYLFFYDAPNFDVKKVLMSVIVEFDKRAERLK